MLIYARTSHPTKNTIVSEESVPLHQIAMCMAASELILKSTKIHSIICDTHVNNNVICCNGIIKLFDQVIH